jgi:serine/threonine-protein kinase
MGDDAQTSRPSLTLRVGEVIAGKFRVERLLGEGGMALVFEATHLMLDERVALKCLRAEVLGRTDLVERFAQESRAAAKLKSEHVARVIDVGEENGIPYMVMEYLEGKNLEEIVTARGPLPISEAVDLVIQACEGISEAHARGIIHRDVKPANLFLAERADGWPTLKILDFGISKARLAAPDGELVDFTSSRKIKTMSLLGSPYYMSPEQLRSTRDVDRRTDVWSLGVVLFELLTAKTPFVANDFVSLAREIFDKPHISLATLRPDAPPGLEALLDRALAKTVEDRFQSAGELALALLPFTNDKRSRVIAAHAVTMTRSSGIDPELPLPSAAPSALSGSNPKLIIPTPPSLPRIEPPKTQSPLQVTPITLPTIHPPTETRRPWLVGLGGAVAALLVVGVLLLIVGPGRTARPTVNTAGRSSEPITPDQASASTPVVASVEAPTPIAPTASSSNAPRSGVALPRAVVVAAPKHSASAAPAATSELDIRRER